MAQTKVKLIDDNAIKAHHIDETATGITLADLFVSGGASISGDLGIGISIPGAPLHVYYTESVNFPGLLIENRNTGNEGRIKIGGTSGAGETYYAEIGYDGAGYLNFYNDRGLITGIASTPAMTIDSSGNVGIGTQTPQSILHISESAPVVTATSTNNASGLRFNVQGTANEAFRFQYNGTSLATILSNGKVGIGTSSPQAILQIVNPTNQTTVPAAGTGATQGVIISNDLNSYGMFVGSTGDGKGYIQQQRTDTATYYDLSLQANGGRVGIGTTSPNNSLTINGSLDFIGNSRYLDLSGGTTSSQNALIIGEQNTYGVRFRWDSGSSLVFDGYWASSTTGAANRTLGSIDVNNRIWYLDDRIDTNRVDINGIPLFDSTDRSGLLEIFRKGTAAWTGIQCNNGQRWSVMGNASNFGIYNDSTSEWVWLHDVNAGITFYYNNIAEMKVESGRVDIYNELRFPNSANTARFNDAGNAIRLYTSTGYLQFGSLNSSWVHYETDRPAHYFYENIWAAGYQVQTSDARIKENVVTIDNALDKVKSLRGVYYNRIGDKDKVREVGFIAQEVNEVVPELAAYAEDMDEWAVKYANFVGLHNEAIKELSNQIDALKAEIELLKQA